MAEKLEKNHLSVLRQRTVEEDLNEHLKSAMGGYTKKSVMEYINLLHEKQQKYAETFNSNMQSVLTEKETLKKENERLLEKITQVESDFQAISDSLKSKDEASEDLKKQLSEIKTENKDLKTSNEQLETRFEHLEKDLSETKAALEKARQDEKNNESSQDLLDTLSKLDGENGALKEAGMQQTACIECLEKDLSEAKAELEKVRQDAKDYKPSQDLLNKLSMLDRENSDLLNKRKQQDTRIERLEKDLFQAKAALDNTRQDVKTQSELLVIEKTETNNQRELNAQFSKTIEEQRQEIEQLNKALSKGELTKLTVKISELMSNAALKAEIIDRQNNELDQKSNKINTLAEENETLRYSMEQINNALRSLTEQNEKLMSANSTLSSNLESDNKRIVQLLNEKSEQTVEKLIATRKFDELNKKISLMQKQSGLKEPVMNEPNEGTNISAS